MEMPQAQMFLPYGSLECGKISSEEIKERIYKCNCEAKFEYDIEFGAKFS